MFASFCPVRPLLAFFKNTNLLRPEPSPFYSILAILSSVTNVSDLTQFRPASCYLHLKSELASAFEVRADG
ncbi:MAG TPA: hypothetical protein DCW97_03995 [Acidobacteria bacterium]|nr:hypothetical protein [Acidobacteriota bacterium]